jgi:hypothetical protein
MFAPDRQGFFPALWVQFVGDLGRGERDTFAGLSSREERVRWMYRHRYPRVSPASPCLPNGRPQTRFHLLRSMRQEKDSDASRTRREAGNQAFQVPLLLLAPS